MADIQGTGSARPGGIFGASSYQMAYALFRITMGVNMFFHGFMRIVGDTGVWVDSQVALFTESFLPTLWVTAFLYVLPFFEVGLGEQRHRVTVPDTVILAVRS